MEYGYLDEHGGLHCKEIIDQVECYTDDEGERQQRIIPAEVVAQALAAIGWKPVMAVDGSKLESPDEDHIIRVSPYDAGEYIDYHYESQFDHKKYLTKIQRLKNDLASSDYKVTKCYEASLMDEEPPYDIAALRQERQAIRDQINDLESTMQFFLPQ